jgi:hypothetical protein
LGSSIDFASSATTFEEEAEAFDAELCTELAAVDAETWLAAELADETVLPALLDAETWLGAADE